MPRNQLRVHVIVALTVVCTFLSEVGNSPLQADSDSEIVARINKLIRQGWEDNEIKPSERSSDDEFARRTALDIVGHIPEYEKLVEFLEDESEDKRAKWIDDQLDNDDYIRNWSGLWGNLLVGRANRRAGGRAALDGWLRNAFRVNIPYDEFVKELITAEGNSNENGAVVFLASHLNEMAVPATSITSRLFLGRQVQCTQCHDHPFNDWQQTQFWGMNSYFRGTRRQGNPNNGGVVLTDQPVSRLVNFEKRSGLEVTTARQFFDGSGRGAVADIDITEDAFERAKKNRESRADLKPREELAKLMLDPKKPFIAETQVNRIWGHLFGYGFTKPVDDLGPHNPSSHPELLAYLATQFREARYDNKRLIRWIAASEAYNLSSLTHPGNAEVDDPGAGNVPLFSHMYLKQFRAEQLYDSLLIATAADQANRNSVQADNQRRTWLRQFVQTFGTDENDETTTFNGTIPQALLLMNGQLMRNALGGGNGSFLRRVVLSKTGRLVNDKATSRPRTVRQARKAQLQAVKARNRNVPEKIETLFLVGLSRKPTKAEIDAFNGTYQSGNYRDPVVGLQDVFWAILNSNEFVINH